jgi:uncharacterized protein (DUF2384 family)
MSKEDLSDPVEASMTTKRNDRLQAEAELIQLVERMVQESGSPDGFDARAWLKRWMASPIPALKGATPASYMKTKEGRKLVAQLLSMMQSGAYA